ncbi:hypothetical protein GCM10009867_32380 [Pedococcus aerophilus]|uniref:Uncharacterized protein n=1 Tax=Pedococcus aerophilus TaxID=436356 RepID=A0ABN3UWH8_9MICO
MRKRAKPHPQYGSRAWDVGLLMGQRFHVTAPSADALDPAHRRDPTGQETLEQLAQDLEDKGWRPRCGAGGIWTVVSRPVGRGRRTTGGAISRWRVTVRALAVGAYFRP